MTTALTFKPITETKFNFAADLIEHQRNTVTTKPNAVKAREGLDLALTVTAEYFKLSPHMLDSINEIKATREWDFTLASARENLGDAFDLLQQQMFEYTNDILDDFSRALPVEGVTDEQAKTNQDLMANIATVLGGFDNAFKSYLGFAKVAYQKYTAKITELSKDHIEQLKELLRNNNHLATQMSSAGKAMLRLMDQLAGVLVNSPENYEFDTDKFDIYNNNGKLHLLPTSDFITETKQGFTNNIKVAILSASEDADVELEYKPIQSQAQSDVGGCMALKYHPGAGIPSFSIPATAPDPHNLPSLMQKFFEMMDATICELVDARYT